MHPSDELALDVVERLEVVAVEWVVEVVVVVVEVVVAVAAAGKRTAIKILWTDAALSRTSVGVRFRPIPHATFSSCSRRIPPRCSSSAPMFGSITTCCASASFDTQPSAAPSAARSVSSPQKASRASSRHRPSHADRADAGATSPKLALAPSSSSTACASVAVCAGEGGGRGGGGQGLRVG